MRVNKKNDKTELEFLESIENFCFILNCEISDIFYP